MNTASSHDLHVKNTHLKINKHLGSSTKTHGSRKYTHLLKEVSDLLVPAYVNFPNVNWF